jgi:hypothetical protein
MRKSSLFFFLFSPFPCLQVSSIVPLLWETVRVLLKKQDGIFVFAFDARRDVPVTIDYVLAEAIQAGFCYELVPKPTGDSSSSSLNNNNNNSNVELYLFRWSKQPQDPSSPPR